MWNVEDMIELLEKSVLEYVDERSVDSSLGLGGGGSVITFELEVTGV